MINDSDNHYTQAGYGDEVDKYLECMNELKRLMSFASKYLKNRQNLRFENLQITIEILCLQYRKIFELIAISSLSTNKKSFTKKHDHILYGYQPEKIMSGIRKINPKFYQVPVINIPKNNEPIYYFKERETDIFSDKELCKAWKLCSEYLHIRNPFKTGLNGDVILNLFFEWHQKIVNHFYNHSIMLSNSDKHFLVSMDFSEESKATEIYFIWPLKK